MRRFLIVVAILALIPGFAMAGPKEDAPAVLEKWATAFTQSDADGIVALYAKDALFLGTQTKSLGVNSAAVRKCFEAALLKKCRGPQC